MNELNLIAKDICKKIAEDFKHICISEELDGYCVNLLTNPIIRMHCYINFNKLKLVIFILSYDHDLRQWTEVDFDISEPNYTSLKQNVIDSIKSTYQRYLKAQNERISNVHSEYHALCKQLGT